MAKRYISWNGDQLIPGRAFKGRQIDPNNKDEFIYPIVQPGHWKQGDESIQEFGVTIEAIEEQALTLDQQISIVNEQTQEQIDELYPPNMREDASREVMRLLNEARRKELTTEQEDYLGRVNKVNDHIDQMRQAERAEIERLTASYAEA